MERSVYALKFYDGDWWGTPSGKVTNFHRAKLFNTSAGAHNARNSYKCRLFAKRHGIPEVIEFTLDMSKEVL